MSIRSEVIRCSRSINFGLNRYTSSGYMTKAITMLINIIMTSNSPMSAKNFSSDRKYHGKIPINTIVAVKKIALPVVVTAARIAEP